MGGTQEGAGSGVASSGEGGFCMAVWDKNANPNTEQPAVLCGLSFLVERTGSYFCAPSWPGTCCVDQAGWTQAPRGRPASGLKVCSNVLGYISSEEESLLPEVPTM